MSLSLKPRVPSALDHPNVRVKCYPVAFVSEGLVRRLGFISVGQF